MIKIMPDEQIERLLIPAIETLLDEGPPFPNLRSCANLFHILRDSLPAPGVVGLQREYLLFQVYEVLRDAFKELGHADPSYPIEGDSDKRHKGHWIGGKGAKRRELMRQTLEHLKAKHLQKELL